MLKFLRDKFFSKSAVHKSYIKICDGICYWLHLTKEHQLIREFLENNVTDITIDEFIKNIYELKKNSKTQNKEQIFTVYEKLMQARDCKMNKKYRECQILCEQILKKFPDDIYTKNMLISVLGKLGNPKVFDLVIKELKMGHITREDTQRVIYGILGNFIDYPDKFLECMSQLAPNILCNYFEQLGENNPKCKQLRKYV